MQREEGQHIELLSDPWGTSFLILNPKVITHWKKTGFLSKWTPHRLLFLIKMFVSLALSILKEGCFYLEYAAKHGYHFKTNENRRNKPQEGDVLFWAWSKARRLQKLKYLGLLLNGLLLLQIKHRHRRTDGLKTEGMRGKGDQWLGKVFFFSASFCFWFCFVFPCQSQKDLNSAPNSQDQRVRVGHSAAGSCDLITSWTPPLPPWEPCANTTAWSSCSVAGFAPFSFYLGMWTLGICFAAFFFFFKKQDLLP